MMAETVVTEIQKNARETVRLGLSEYRGHQLMFARIWADTGETAVPTQKGLTVKVEMLPDLIEGLQEVQREAIRAGLLAPQECAA